MVNLDNFSSIFIGNWKLNGNIDFVKEYCDQLKPNPKNCTVICPPSIYLNRIKINNRNLFSGAQDVSLFEDGAYTGELSAKMLSEDQIKFCIVGHSERREYFSETNEVIRSKSINLIQNKVIPIICVGETLVEKEKQLTKEILEKQIEESISDLSDYKNTIIAYEPIWAIGTGLTPSIEEIEEVHKFIKNIRIRYNKYKVIYGGSVKATNSAKINSLDNVDGCLIGGASLKVDEFNSIIS